MENVSRRYDVNSPMHRNGSEYTKYKICLSIMMAVCIKQHLKASFETRFMKKLSNTESKLKKSVVYKKKRVIFVKNLCVTWTTVFTFISKTFGFEFAIEIKKFRKTEKKEKYFA